MPAPRLRAFTLLELLVVVAIIAVIASLLLPALQNARAIARRTACLSGARQVFTGAILYADDAAEYLPNGSMTDAYQAVMTRHGYLPQAIFTRRGGCPDGQATFFTSSGDPIRTGVPGYTPRTTYGLNGLLQSGYGRENGVAWVNFGPRTLRMPRLDRYPDKVAVIVCSPVPWDRDATQAGLWRPLFHVLGYSQNGTWDIPEPAWLRHQGRGLPMVTIDGHGEFVPTRIVTANAPTPIVGAVPWDTASSAFIPSTIMDFSFSYLYRNPNLRD
jgi:prepilin-type N-terminal cleavage/methylation domain-containing protein